MGDACLHWSVRLAVGCYLYRVLILLRCGGRDAVRTVPPGCLSTRVRVVWTVGWAAFLLHVWAAFEFVHEWSHAAAWQHTARQTAAVTGWNSGSGLWFNYAFALLWTGDIVRQWACRPADGDMSSKRHCRRLWPRWAVPVWETVLAVIVFNATVVFGPPFWISCAVVFGVGCIVAVRQRHADRRLSARHQDTA